MLATRAADASCALVYVNQVGGQDELVFDGASMVFDADGELVARAPQFVEDVARRRPRRATPSSASACSTRGAGSAPSRCPRSSLTERAAADRRPPARPVVAPALDPVAEVYDALVLGTARLRAEERLHRRRDRPVRRHRLVAGGRASPPTPSGPSTSTACRCRRATRARAPAPTPRSWPAASASTTARSPSRTPSPPSSTCWRRRSTAASPTSPRRTCRAASAACC